MLNLVSIEEIIPILKEHFPDGTYRELEDALRREKYNNHSLSVVDYISIKQNVEKVVSDFKKDHPHCHVGTDNGKFVGNEVFNRDKNDYLFLYVYSDNLEQSNWCIGCNISAFTFEKIWRNVYEAEDRCEVIGVFIYNIIKRLYELLVHLEAQYFHLEPDLDNESTHVCDNFIDVKIMELLPTYKSSDVDICGLSYKIIPYSKIQVSR